MPLTLPQLRDVCLANQAAVQCRYLRLDDDDYRIYYCEKKRPTEKKNIDSMVQTYLEECTLKGKDPWKANNPIGDNCSGYRVMKYIQQGYDVD